jgi:Fe2+ transport system protein FeoA
MVIPKGEKNEKMGIHPNSEVQIINSFLLN